MLNSNSFYRSFGMIALAMFLATSCASKNNLKKKQAELYFGAGTQSLMSKDYTEALKSLLEANKLDPENSDIITNLGMAYYFKGEKELAIRTLKEALELNKNNSDAKLNLASIYYRDADYNNAEILYKKVLQDLTYDKQARTLFNLGMLELQAKRNTVSAENYFKKSIKEDDNYCPSYYQLAMIQFQRRQFNTALKNFKESGMGTCYEAPAPHYYQALTLIELGRFEEARIKLDEVSSRFNKTAYATKARTKAIELNDIENRFKSSESHASRKVLESPDF